MSSRLCCRVCGLPWPGDGYLSDDELRRRASPRLPVCINTQPSARWFVDTGVNGHIFDDEHKESNRG